MFEELKKITDAPLQQMKAQQVAQQAQRMGSIHFTFKKWIGDPSLKMQWNVYYGEHITPDLVKKELKKWSKLMEEENKKQEMK